MECKENSATNAEEGKKSVIVVVENCENNNSKVDEKVKAVTYFVTRAGKEDETPPKDLDKYEEWKKKKEDKQKKIDEDLESYKGCFYRSGFQSTRAIDLLGVEFLGPKTGKSGDFLVKLRIERTRKVSLRRWWYILRFLLGQSDKEFVTDVLLDTFTARVNGVRGKFRVNFPHPVTIEAGKWTDILFELDGPKTTRLPLKRVIEAEFKDDITLYFLYGPRQLSGFYFTLADNSM